MFRYLALGIALCFVLTWHPALAAPVAEPVRTGDGLSPNRPVNDKWALVVGISRFANPKISLRFAAKDASDFCNFLVGEGNFARDHVVLLTDQRATRANILSLLGDKWLPHVANPDDLVVLYFSSHGSPAESDVGGVNYLVAYDTNIDELYATGIPLQDLMRIIKKRVHCDRVVIVLDACHSGAATPDAKGMVRVGNVDAAQFMAGTGQLVIASSKPDQVSWEGTKYENGVFTKNLISSLRKNGVHTKLGDAFVQLKNSVQQETLLDRGQLQTPEMKSLWKGEQLEICLRPAAPREGIPLASLGLEGSVQHTHLDESTPVSQNREAKMVLNNGNIYRVFNRPSAPTVFRLDSPGIVSFICTYHWNDGKGSPPGTVAIRNDDGTIYGPWACRSRPGQGGVPNAYWEVEPMLPVKAGTYTLLDSSPRTWSQNAGTAGAGIAIIKVLPAP